jgi:hypothetical protein
MSMTVEDSPQPTPAPNPTFELESELCTGIKMDGCPGVFDDPNEELGPDGDGESDPVMNHNRLGKKFASLRGQI